MSINITVWNEFIHERDKPEVAKIYPDGSASKTSGEFANSDAVDIQRYLISEVHLPRLPPSPGGLTTPSNQEDLQ